MGKKLPKTLMMGCGALGLFLGQIPGEAVANTISVGSNPTTVPDGANFKWTYSAALLNGKVRAGEGLVTIYDFRGFVSGSATAPLGWSFSSNGTGTTPGDLGPVGNLFDDSGIPNLTWTYTGSEKINLSSSTTVDLGSFSADSTLSDSGLDKYVTQDRSLPSDAAADGAVSGSFGSTDVPIQRVVPDGGSSVILLGLALLGLGGFACRKSVI